MAYLGDQAEHHYDYEFLVKTYTEVTLPLEKLTVLVALAKAPALVRKALYARAQGEHALVDAAIAYAKEKL